MTQHASFHVSRDRLTGSESEMLVMWMRLSQIMSIMYYLDNGASRVRVGFKTSVAHA